MPWYTILVTKKWKESLYLYFCLCSSRKMLKLLNFLLLGTSRIKNAVTLVSISLFQLKCNTYEKSFAKLLFQNNNVIQQCQTIFSSRNENIYRINTFLILVIGGGWGTFLSSSCPDIWQLTIQILFSVFFTCVSFKTCFIFLLWKFGAITVWELCALERWKYEERRRLKDMQSRLGRVFQYEGLLGMKLMKIVCLYRKIRGTKRVCLDSRFKIFLLVNFNLECAL